MRRVKVNWAELEDAFGDTPDDASAFLDLETGEVVGIDGEPRRMLWQIYESIDDPGAAGQTLVIPDVMDGYCLPDWQRALLEEADRIESGLDTRYVEIPHDETPEAYRDMQRFVGTVEDPSFEQFLWDTIGGRGAFRRFRDALDDRPAERERWYEFKRQRVRQRVLDWLQSIGVAPVDETPVELPSLREPTSLE